MRIPKATKLSSGMWSIQLRLGGVSRTITAESKRKVENMATLYKSEYKNGLIEPVRASQGIKKPTLRSAMESYISVLTNVLSPSTIRGYDTIARTRFKAWADMRLDDIKDWQEVLNEEAETCSAKTLKNAWSFAKGAIERQGVKIGKVTLPSVAKKEHTFLDVEEAKRFVRLLKGTDIEAVCLLALHSLRRSEILALTKADINLNEGQYGMIHVNGAAVLDKNNVLVEKDTNKTDLSTRSIPILIPRLREVINEHPDGKFITVNPHAVWRKINKFCEKNGFPILGFHGFRHTFVVIAFDAGLNAFTTQRVGGWSNPNTVNDIYYHLSLRQKNEAFEKISEVWADDGAE